MQGRRLSEGEGEPTFISMMFPIIVVMGTYLVILVGVGLKTRGVKIPSSRFVYFLQCILFWPLTYIIIHVLAL